MQQAVISFPEFQFLKWDLITPNNAEAAEPVPANNLSQNKISEMSFHFHSLRSFSFLNMLVVFFKKTLEGSSLHKFFFSNSKCFRLKVENQNNE